MSPTHDPSNPSIDATDPARSPDPAHSGTTKAGFKVQGHPDLDDLLTEDETLEVQAPWNAPAPASALEDRTNDTVPRTKSRGRPAERARRDDVRFDSSDLRPEGDALHGDLRSQQGIPGTRNTSSKPTVTGGIKIDVSITIQRSAEDLFRFWRNFENLPQFMRHLESVHVISTRRSHWITKAPGGSQVEWDAEIITETPNEMISWRTVEGQVAHAGSVWFHAAPGGRGTEVRVQLMYDPPAGRLGAFLARLLGEAPEQQIRDDLRQLRAWMECGEIPTTDGQSRGPTRAEKKHERRRTAGRVPRQQPRPPVPHG